ncbi:hypothetical protein H8M03_10265 [Sphingomonas sabuli]|uniref:Uncharacterized protein n=1 Tax=Sphingomonas sabuli TaxID=2764186 RepID=A0A7G9L190_9SPHN|nr:hypothetical protein [Sphingomonas sabuli]QNM82389.1 hypothetical protein H8M03_10265 [Sphingomonas sabuli]
MRQKPPIETNDQHDARLKRETAERERETRKADDAIDAMISRNISMYGP